MKKHIDERYDLADHFIQKYETIDGLIERQTEILDKIEHINKTHFNIETGWSHKDYQDIWATYIHTLQIINRAIKRMRSK